MTEPSPSNVSINDLVSIKKEKEAKKKKKSSRDKNIQLDKMYTRKEHIKQNYRIRLKIKRIKHAM